MKIAIPLEDGRLCQHFGRCEEFALFELDEDNNVIASQSLQPPAHEPGVLPAWLREHGAEVIIAGGMGRRAQQLFAQSDITVVVGAQADSPEELIAAYSTGALSTGENVCDH